MKKLLTLTALGLVLTCSEAYSSGFYLKEQSASAQGNAYAGATAGAEDISYSYFNPAALSRFKGSNVYAGGTWIAPKSTAHNASNSFGEHNDYMGDIVHSAASPHAYISQQINDDLTIGLSLNAPFGMITKYGDDWAGRNHGTLSKIISATFTPMASYKVNDQLSLGAGLPIQYIRATLRNGVIAGVNPLTGALIEDKSTVHGDTIDVGYQLGALYEPIEGTRFGAGYRSQVRHKIKGDIEFDGPLSMLNQDLSCRLTTPATLTLGAYHDINEDWAVMAEYSRVYWSSFNRLIMQGAQSGQLSYTDEKWKDTDFYALGVSKQLDSQWKLRLGLAYEKGAVGNEYRTPRIPDSNRLWYSAGLQYQYNEKLTFNVGYTHIVADSSKVSLRGDHTGDARRGALDVSYHSKINIIAASISYNF
ncbi:MAG: outer membrane protein transport protein [Alphaproteobacteria bacterium]|nr:outer membrane protein transport protein [Alphaproteobacteria bacterium]